MKNLWGGRFKKGMHPLLACFSYSLYIDFELLEAELAVNEAWVRMLAKAGYMTSQEASRVCKALKVMGRELKPKDPHAPLPQTYLQKYEDVHTLIQSLLEKKVRSVAKKLHTGRSRNDLVVTSMRVYLKNKNKLIQSKISQAQKALIACAEKAKGSIVPGMTHLRKAQPVLLAHHLLAYVEMLEEDKQRLQDAHKRIDVLVLGSGALSGSALAIDQKFLARQLKFSKIATNSMFAVSDRAFLTEFVSDLALLWMHLSRLSEDFILWNCEAFNYVELDDAFATGSSLMPHKKNPDVFELIRGRSSVIFGHLQSLLTLQKGLPLAYNRDLQEDKPGLFDSIRKTQIALDILSLTLESLKWNSEAMAQATEEDGLFATDILDYLVKRKVAFREAHEIVGQIVASAKEQERSIQDFQLEEWKKFSRVFSKDIEKIFHPAVSVQAKRTIGSTHPSHVKKELARWKRMLKG